MRIFTSRIAAGALCLMAMPGGVAANAYREKGIAAAVAGGGIVVVPPRDWNRLDTKPGRQAETWTLDGEQLNDVTFYAGIAAGEPLLRERRKREPLPRFTVTTLLVEVPELLEGTYRAHRKIGRFTLTGSTPGAFLGHAGIRFTYDYVDRDELPRRGEARAALIGGKLYMATFDAPRLHYFDRTVGAYRALADAARLAK